MYPYIPYRERRELSRVYLCVRVRKESDLPDILESGVSVVPQSLKNSNVNPWAEKKTCVSVKNPQKPHTVPTVWTLQVRKKVAV